jgi:hypothetical protein
MINSNQSAIVVMDIGSPKYLHDYYTELEINNKFIEYLNERLIGLQRSGFKIILSNFISDKNEKLSLVPDAEIINLTELMKYLDDNGIKNVVYTGFHYPVCTHNGRPTSSQFLKESAPNLKVYVCPFLSRPPTFLIGGITPDDNLTEIKQIML